VVQAATTLLAQVDSGIGGKTAINHDKGKNLIGTFHQPLTVISDVDLLDTLDHEQVTGAMAEVLKYGVIMDAPLFEYLEAGPPFDYERIVRMCARDKARVVARDEREGGVRRTLNFGHTLGHAVEKSTGYTLGHGRAVALGMAFAARLSHRMGMLPPEDLGRIMGLMSRLELLPVGIDLPRAEEVAEALQVDKKGAQGGVHFVLTPFIGGVSVRKLSEIEVLEAYHGFAVEYSKGL
jgi:3-dehydroquinate synthase